MQIGLTPLTLISPCTAPHSRRHPHPHHLQSHTSPCIMYTLTGGPTPPGVYKLLPRSTLPKTPTPPSIAHLPLHHVYTHRWPYTPRRVQAPALHHTLPVAPYGTSPTIPYTSYDDGGGLVRLGHACHTGVCVYVCVCVCVHVCVCCPTVFKQ